MTRNLTHTIFDSRKDVLIMGILNVTPDSFSDGGEFTTQGAVLAQADTMIAEGADIIDIGGESTRPFAEKIPLEEELRRTIPVIRAIRKHHTTPISIDTTKAEVALQAIDSGADIVNDISALRFDPDMARVVREKMVPVIMMHMLGTPENMQVAPVYGDVIGEIRTFLAERIAWAESVGISKKSIILDPGLGFGKTVQHNLSIVKHISEFRSLGCPVLIGHSRKSFIGKILDLEVDSRDPATAVISSFCFLNGADILRVHNVGLTVQAVRLAQSLNAAG